MDYSPIALFVYNRPRHTLQTLEALATNKLADKSRLYIFADGPKTNATEEDLIKIGKVRRLVREQKWCDTLLVQESDTNLGLARSIVQGVTSVVNEFGRVIVLEDDIVTTPGFLQYMNSALSLYQDDLRVMQIAGFMFPTWRILPETGFLRKSTSWGWATWKRAWKNYSSDTEKLIDGVERIGIEKFNLDGCSFHYDALCKNMSGELRTWAVKWYASIYIHGGLCLYPHRSLVRNEGFDGTGIHCENDNSSFYQRMKLARHINLEPRNVCETSVYLKAIQSYYQNRLRCWTHTRLRDRAIGKIKRVLSIASTC